MPTKQGKVNTVIPAYSEKPILTEDVIAPHRQSTLQSIVGIFFKNKEILLGLSDESDESDESE